MPVRKTSGGYKSGYKAKTYKATAKAKRQQRAAHASGYGRKAKSKS